MASITRRKLKSGKYSYRAEVLRKVNGEIVFRESQTFSRKIHADQWARNLEVELDKPGGLDLKIKERNNFNDDITFSELVDRYIKVAYPAKPWGRTKTDTLRLLQTSKFGQLKASAIGARDIIDHCRNWGASPATVNQHYIYIRGVFSIAREVLGCNVNYEEVERAQKAMSKLGIIAKSGSRERRPTINEMTQIIATAYQRRKKWEELDKQRGHDRTDLILLDKALLFAMFSSRRQEEICRITRTDTDYERQRVLIKGMKHPSKKSTNDVWCYVPNEAWKIMLSMPEKEGDDRWFPYYSRTLGDRFRQIQKELGMWDLEDKENNLRFHDLRHECISWLFEKDGWNGERWDIARVASVSGHQSWNMLQRYTQMERLEPYNKWQDWEWYEKVLD